MTAILIFLAGALLYVGLSVWLRWFALRDLLPRGGESISELDHKEVHSSRPGRSL
jgi:hypothetical protein